MPVIIFDIDGTLANLEHRRHFVNGPKKDWKNFLASIDKDSPIEQTIYLNKVLFQENTVFLCSGRSEDEREVTEKWLRENKVSYDRLFMRPAGDYRADTIIKKEILDQIRSEGHEPWLIFDDRECVTKMWRENGLFVLQCDPNPSSTLHDTYMFNKTIEYPLIIMVGPSGAGKTTCLQMFSKSVHQSIISSDLLRLQICGDFKDQTQNERVFQTMHHLANERLKLGLPVILDATHIKRADRLKAAKLLPETFPVLYQVIDRPLADKIKTAGWRSEISVKGKPLVEYHHQVFQSNLKDILKGDGLPNVIVNDMRIKDDGTTNA